jgi:hypothetical protein
MFKPTHKIVTESTKVRDNGVVHCYKRGTLVQSLAGDQLFVKVVNENGSVQFVRPSDMEAI